MKQIASLLFLALLWYIGFGLYNLYWEKKYSSNYQRELTQKSVSISKIDFDKDKIDKLNKQIKELTVDSTYKLKLYNLKWIEQQPLFIDAYASIYDKILQQQRTTNNYSQ